MPRGKVRPLTMATTATKAKKTAAKKAPARKAPAKKTAAKKGSGEEQTVEVVELDG